MERVIGTKDLQLALQNWTRQREQVALLLQAFSLTLPTHSVLIHGLQANRLDDDAVDLKFGDLHLESADRLAAELQELARRARHYQTLRALHDPAGDDPPTPVRAGRHYGHS